MKKLTYIFLSLIGIFFSICIFRHRASTIRTVSELKNVDQILLQKFIDPHSRKYLFEPLKNSNQEVYSSAIHNGVYLPQRADGEMVDRIPSGDESVFLHVSRNNELWTIENSGRVRRINAQEAISILMSKKRVAQIEER